MGYKWPGPCELLHPDKEYVKLRYSLAHAVVKQGETSYRHKLKHSEVYYILEGKGMMYIDNESVEVREGWHCPQLQTLHNFASLL